MEQPEEVFKKEFHFYSGLGGYNSRGSINQQLLPEIPMAWLNKIPLSLILPLAVLLALAPFSPEPHLWEKLKMLADGTLVKPVDIFDLFLHGTPLVILLLKLSVRTDSA
jgi:hypothetical protein